MGWQIFRPSGAGNYLAEEGDDATQTVTTYDTAGNVLTSTAYSAEQVAQMQAQQAAQAAQAATAAAQSGIDTLFANQSALSTQLQADISSVTTTGWDSLTAADRDAIMLRILNGFGTSMQAQMDHLTVTGHNPNVG